MIMEYKDILTLCSLNKHNQACQFSFTADFSLVNIEICGKKNHISAPPPPKLQFRGFTDTYLVTHSLFLPFFLSFSCQFRGVSDIDLVKNPSAPRSLTICSSFLFSHNWHA